MVTTWIGRNFEGLRLLDGILKVIIIPEKNFEGFLFSSSWTKEFQRVLVLRLLDERILKVLAPFERTSKVPSLI
ncbi:hypothetical protein RIR_jg32041.t1 [Rhizophagus irregularis DAOM 181602=DAOM 197198]|nr:hypothetical protein RIR_jg32041.t1 [Rhizophagus irregularis DAOM 181602=DAOM 197198]